MDTLRIEYGLLQMSLEFSHFRVTRNVVLALLASDHDIEITLGLQRPLLHNLAMQLSQGKDTELAQGRE